MKMNKTALLALVSSALLATSVYADFDGRKGQRGRHFDGPGFGMPLPGMMIGRMAEHLDLDDAQRESVRNTIEAARPEIEALRDQMRANREALQALDVNNPGYELELNAIAQSNGQLATDGTLLFTRIRTEIRAVLTDEQIEKLERSKARMKKAFERRLQRR